MSAFGKYASRVVRYSGIYMIGPTLTLVIGIGSLVVLTRLMTPGDYGRFAILLAYGSFVTLLCNLGVYQGTNRAGFSTSDHDELPIARYADDTSDRAGERRRQAAIGTGIGTTLILGVITIALSSLFAGGIVSAVLHKQMATGLFGFAALEGAAISVWRLVVNLLRLGRRPVVWVMLQASRPVLSLGGAIVGIEIVGGIRGAITGWAVGTMVAALTALVVTRRNYILLLDPRAILPIYKFGAAMMPAMIGFWIMHTLDIFVVARYATVKDVGRYRVAARIGALASVPSTAFLMGWGPLTRDPVYIAATRERPQEEVDRTIYAYFTYTLFGFALFICLFNRSFAVIVPSSYGDVAALVPLLTLRWVARALYQTSFRLVNYPQKRRDFGLITLFAALVYVAAIIELGRTIGIYGIAAGTVVGPLTGFVVMLAVARARGTWPTISFARSGAALALAGGCYAADYFLTRNTSQAYAIGWFALYGVLLVATGLVPWSHLAAAAEYVRTESDRDRPGVWARARSLSPQDRAVLLSLLARPVDGRDGGSEPPLAEFVAMLRTVGRIGAPMPYDDAVGTYILWQGAPAERDVYAGRLWNLGADPSEVDALVRLYTRLRRHRLRRRELARSLTPTTYSA